MTQNRLLDDSKSYSHWLLLTFPSDCKPISISFHFHIMSFILYRFMYISNAIADVQQAFVGPKHININMKITNSNTVG